MTRFARAKGSKASNERVPEQATSWAEMKEQLTLKNKEIEEAKKRDVFMNKRTANYKAFLDEKAQEKKKSEWSVFPKARNGKQNINNSVSEPKKRMNSFKKSVEIDEISSDDETFKDLKCKLDSVLNDTESKNNKRDSPPNKANGTNVKKLKKKKVKGLLGTDERYPEKLKGNEITSKDSKNKIENMLGTKKSENDSDSDAPPDEESSKKKIMAPTVELKKKKKKKIKILINEVEKKTTLQQGEDYPKNLEAGDFNVPEKKQKKRKIVDVESKNKKIKKSEKIDNNEKEEKNLKKKGKKSGPSTSKQPEKKSKEDLTEQDLKKIEKKKQKRIRQLEKKKKIKEQLKKEKLLAEQSVPEQVANSSPTNLSQDDNKSKIKNPTIGNDFNGNNFRSPKKFNKFEKRTPKIRDKEEHKRKKPFQPHKMFINGKEVEVDYVEGFPVKKEDAERLKQLRKDMIAKGLPGSEIKISMKLERRKAEKAFAREKKKVCFNCRKSGHNLSECPEVGKSELSQNLTSGICFKCGSTEHTHFECKVVKGQDFKYAQCFICNEQGHISRQCPDNARGLYPKGGSCNVCGDVTHLKKDCPQYQAQQQRHESSLQIETLSGSNPDVLDEKSTNNRIPVNRRSNKIIKF